MLPCFPCSQLIYLASRTAVQQAFLAIQVEEATATASDPQNATTDAPSQELATDGNRGGNRGDEQEDKEDGVFGDEAASEEEDGLKRANRRLRGQLGGIGNHQRDGFEDGGTGCHDGSAARRSIPITPVLVQVSN